MRSARLRQGVAVFSSAAFCCLLITNLYTPDAGTETNEFDSRNDARRNALPHAVAILEATSQHDDKNRQDGSPQERKTDHEYKSWKESKSWMKNKTNERKGAIKASSHRNVIASLYKNEEKAHNKSSNYPENYRKNFTQNPHKLNPDYHQRGPHNWGAPNSRNSLSEHRADQNNRSASNRLDISRDHRADFVDQDSPPTFIPDHRRVLRNRGAMNSLNLGEYRTWGGERADYRYKAPSRGQPRLWPEDSNGTDDRILAQLHHIPRTYMPDATDPKQRTRTKKIYVPGGLGDVPSGRRKFIEDGCGVNACSLTMDSRFRSTADMVLLQIDAYFEQPPSKPRDQIWVMWLLESPINTAVFRHLENVVNWTATYRSDSTIVTPYEKFVVDPAVRQVSNAPRNYAAGKTKLVAWFVSNCLADNRRWDYMLELRRYVPVDVFGACGERECQRQRDGDCNEMLKADYKFYLSFENSNCEYYITEKFFQRALWNDVVPIAMGARKSDYATVAPPHSYIHVEDFATPRHLADYLLKLNASDDLYNEYFAWKTYGHFVNTKFWCRLCALLHDDSGHVSWYPDVEKWWRGKGSCTSGRWDDPKSLITDWVEFYKSGAKGK